MIDTPNADGWKESDRRDAPAVAPFTGDDDRGCRNLLVNIVRQAIDDWVIIESWIFPDIIRRELEAWLFGDSDETDPGSLANCCAWLGLNIHAVRRSVRDKAAAKLERMAKRGKTPKPATTELLNNYNWRTEGRNRDATAWLRDALVTALKPQPATIVRLLAGLPPDTAKTTVYTALRVLAKSGIVRIEKGQNQKNIYSLVVIAAGRNK